MIKRIGIIGVGNIGATLTQMMLQNELPVHIGLYDVHQNTLQGKVWDLEEASVIGDYEGSIEIVSSVEDFVSYDILVVTAGRARTPGMDRKDLLKENAFIIQSIAEQLRGFKGVVLIITNPVDLMVRLFQQLHGLPSCHVLGMAGVLDQGRMAARIKDCTGIKGASLQPCVVGPHSDHMLPLSKIGFGPGDLKDIVTLSDTQKEAIAHDTRHGGARIISKLKTGSAFYAPATSCLRIIQNLLELKQEVLTCSVRIEACGPFNNAWDHLYFGWPVLLGEKGVKSGVTPCMCEKEVQILQKALKNLEQEYDTFLSSI